MRRPWPPRAKMVLGHPNLSSIPRTSLMFRPNHLEVARMAQLLLKIYLLLKLLAYFPLTAHFHRLPIHEKCHNVIAFASHSLHSALELTLIAVSCLLYTSDAADE